MRLDIVDDFDCGVGDVGHVLAVRVFHQVRRCADNDVTEAVSRDNQDTKASTYTPSTPVWTAILASSMWHRMCVRICKACHSAFVLRSES